MRLLLFFLAFAVAGLSQAQPVRYASDSVTRSIVSYPEHMAGRKTASGDLYDPNDLTVAHASLPFGTRLELFAPSTGRSAMVTVTDRGFTMGSDELVASTATMRRLGLSTDREGAVQITAWDETRPAPERTRSAPRPTVAIPAPRPETAGPRGFAVQLASFMDRASADALAEKLEKTWIESADIDGRPVYRVYYGKYRERAQAEAWQVRLEGLGITGYVRTLK